MLLNVFPFTGQPLTQRINQPQTLTASRLRKLGVGNSKYIGTRYFPGMFTGALTHPLEPETKVGDVTFSGLATA